jgi:cytochrome c peroxidase
MLMAALTAAGCLSTEAQQDDTSEAASAVVSVPQSVKVARVGRQIFFDVNLSSPAGQSCATCHDHGTSFVDPDSNVPTSEGVIPGRFGNRNTPTAAYAQYSPDFQFDTVEELWFGGQFWDGRASTLEEQAKGPFLNPIEMNNTSKDEVIDKIRVAGYAPLFLDAFGPSSLDDVETAYDLMATAIAEFERTRLFAPFTSKYDAYLAGNATLSPAEASGLSLFEDPAKGNCAACHLSQPSGGTPPLFTDFTYDNIGVPKNPNNPFYNEPMFNPEGSAFLDRGLGVTVNDPSLDGAVKVATLRNLGRTGPYMHNGAFTTLKEVVHFYNTRDVASWPAPELPATMNTEELGDLGLTDSEEDDIVAFLQTLDDAAPSISSGCNKISDHVVNNAEWPYHEPGTCGASEHLPDEATITCGGSPLKYYGYFCYDLPDGSHTWTAYFGCCG